MDEKHKRAALKQLETKLDRQEEAVSATKGLIAFLNDLTTPVEKQTPKR